MPVHYYDVPIEQLILHKKVYNIISIRGTERWSDWNIHEFEGAIIQRCPYHGIWNLNEFKDYIKDDLEILDQEMPFLKFKEAGQHYAYELFLSIPEQWGARGEPGFWNKLAREFTYCKLPMKQEDFIQMYKNIVSSYWIPIGREEYINIPEFDHGGMSVGMVGGLFAEHALDLLLSRLEKY